MKCPKCNNEEMNVAIWLVANASCPKCGHQLSVKTPRPESRKKGTQLFTDQLIDATCAREKLIDGSIEWSDL